MNILKINLFAFALFSTISFMGCGNIEIVSKYRIQEVLIDGKNTEWDGGIMIKELNASLTVLNDDNFLYLSILSSDKSLSRKILFNGLTIWFDIKASDNKDFGVHFPIGIKDFDFQQIPNNPDDNQNFREKTDNLIEKGLAEFEIVGREGKVIERISRSNKKELEVNVSIADDKFLYELKIPLKNNDDISYGIGTDVGKTITIGFESGQINVERMRNRMNDQPMGNPEGDEPPGIGMQGGGNRRGGDERQRKIDAPKPLNFWVKVFLNKNN